jgi:hypothetical protein
MMVFSLEALAALHGDSLLLHYGEQDNPKSVLIDGGPGAVYGQSLRPRLDELRAQLVASGALADGDPLTLPLAMISHIDDDHIGGMLRLVDAVDTDFEAGRPAWLDVRAFWLNTFQDVTGQAGQGASFTPAEQEDSKTAAVVASVGQGRDLRALVEKHWPLNPKPFDGGLVEAPETGGVLKPLDGDTSLLIVSPQAADIAKFRKEWDEQITKLMKGAAKPAQIATAVDKSPYNLSSIVLLARQGNSTMLLTGDANGDHVRTGLKSAGALDTQDKLHVNVLKLPHHGSKRNVDLAFFQHLTADHYVISANGKYDNPDTQTLEWIVQARGQTGYTLHLTYAGQADDLADRLKAFREKYEDVVIETRPDDALSLRVDLADAPFAQEAVA